MLWTLYKEEDGSISAVKMRSETPEDVETLLDFVERFKSKPDGSGTGRYGDHDNWTLHGDGSKYPPSYGIDPDQADFTPGVSSPCEPLEPFVPVVETDSEPKQGE